MPKPFPNLTGSGCHVHASLWSTKDGSNVFDEETATLDCPKPRYHLSGESMHNAEALCAIAIRCVNSYKRINAPATLSGATWAPNAVTYAGNNRTHMIRDPGCRAVRTAGLADGAANPYLLQAAVLAAGLDANQNNRDPAGASTSTCTPRATRQKCQEAALEPARRASAPLERSSLFKAAFGEDVCRHT